jgi:hypothetical protein
MKETRVIKEGARIPRPTERPSGPPPTPPPGPRQRLSPPEPWPGPPVDDGGPAFPAHIAQIQGIATHSGEFAVGGMSLRDYLAGQVITGYATRITAKVGDSWPSTADFARWAYEQADAMLKAREQ